MQPSSARYVAVPFFCSQPSRLLPSKSDHEEPPVKEDLDWIALRDFVEDDKAMMPHCMSTYAHLVVNGDATTRSCWWMNW